MTSTDSLSLTGKVAIITGSGKENGIGAAMALTLARAGARVAINYVSDSTAPRAAEVVAKIEAAAGKGSVVVVQADVGTPEGTKKLVNEALEKLNVDHIDILVNNAAWASPRPALLQTPEELTRAFQVAVLGPLFLIQAIVPHMPRGGRIINIGTVASKLGHMAMPIYASSKAAMDTLTFAVSQELGRGHGITINTIAPGPVLTDSLPPGIPAVDQLKNSLVAMTRMEDRVGTVDDIADALLLLTSEKSRWITGQFISVSGGITGN